MSDEKSLQNKIYFKNQFLPKLLLTHTPVFILKLLNAYSLLCSASWYKIEDNFIWSF